MEQQLNQWIEEFVAQYPERSLRRRLAEDLVKDLKAKLADDQTPWPTHQRCAP